jgi:2-keto-4-pentenoate hydratase/2-oxohepta-3-ene-1,7-dioic acid hydratase in catechol pathway
MKFVTYLQDGSSQLGVLEDEFVVHIGKAVAAYQANLGQEATPDVPSDMLSLLQEGTDAVDLIREAVNWAMSNEMRDVSIPLGEIKLQAPITGSSKVVGIGLNYADHCREQNIPLPESVLLFAKFPSSIIGPEESITWDPSQSQAVDYEAEVAVIIGKEGFRVEPEDAWDYVAGYTIVNDISARDAQFADKQWVRGKSFDTFCPLGPFIATPDEIDDPDNLNIKTRLNGELVQDSNTKEMVFKIPEIISSITKSITLVPGDIICTGTPDGVGYFRDPKILLKPGDVVEIEIDGLGILRNPVV